MYDDDVIRLITSLLIGMILGVFIGSIISSAWYDGFDKFCPECGHRYKTEAEYCSYDGSELKMIGESK